MAEQRVERRAAVAAVAVAKLQAAFAAFVALLLKVIDLIRQQDFADASRLYFSTKSNI